MATQTLSPQLSSPQTHSGTTISDLDKMVENCLVTGPFMTLAQLRILLRVADACEECGATGSARNGLRCAPCNGRGYRDQAVQ